MSTRTVPGPTKLVSYTTAASPAFSGRSTERPWPAGAVAVQCLVDPGTDKSASWGPGLGLGGLSRDRLTWLRSPRGRRQVEAR